MSKHTSAHDRLKDHNPFVVGLFDRPGIRHDNFQLFDGRSKLVAFPMERFDGFPLENESYFFVPAVILVVAAILLPVVPLFVSLKVTVYVVAAFLIGVGCISMCVMFHLIGLRTTYSSASSDIHATDFAQRARGVRSLIHTFKSIVRWRRFMRYSMNLGYYSLPLVAAAEAYILLHQGKFVLISPEPWRTGVSLALLVMCAMVLPIFERGRKKFTQGMDPTLALVHMVEEIGGQLLASRQTNIVGNEEK